MDDGELVEPVAFRYIWVIVAVVSWSTFPMVILETTTLGPTYIGIFKLLIRDDDDMIWVRAAFKCVTCRISGVLCEIGWKMGRRYSRSPSPRGYGYYSRRGRSPSPRGRYRSRARDLPTSLLVRNLRHDCRIEDLRGPFGEFGPLKDVYLPRDYYTGEPRGFGFVQYIDPDDAAEAKYRMDGQILLGRELTVVFAEENRKKPSEMKARERVRGRSSSIRYSRSPRHGHSYSPSPCYGRAYSRSPNYYSPSPRRRRYSRSISPRGRKYRERSYSGSPYGSRSRSWSRSRSPESY
ncbi:hypothetical protein BUALT_Bualt16G0128800 [Buddleja alternifolia]|uniref:RRM domain-containing protein n=1 Tax=Buddleja alternifolia TaxID=168488 RepID=A0AAV6WBC0_9LAMI|nr:hypothetical protein BUALT_Bualt16G0128800 [Buddleja alternifolia]